MIFVANNRNNPYNNFYNLGFRNHPNFFWSNNNPKVFRPPSQAYNDPKKESKLEEVLGKFMESTEAFIHKSETNFNNQAAAIRNLEVQVGQLAEKLTERPQGSWPSNSEKNPKQCLAIIATEKSKKEAEQEEKSTSQKLNLPSSISPQNVEGPKHEFSVSNEENEKPISTPTKGVEFFPLLP